MPAILHEDIEAQQVAFLAAALDARPEPVTSAVGVRNRVPAGNATDPRPTRLVTVRDDGGPSLGDVRAVARMGYNVWAEDEGAASDLANLVAALVAGCADGDPVVRAVVTRPYSVPDDGRWNLYFTAELWVRGTNL